MSGAVGRERHQSAGLAQHDVAIGVNTSDAGAGLPIKAERCQAARAEAGVQRAGKRVTPSGVPAGVMPESNRAR